MPGNAAIGAHSPASPPASGAASEKNTRFTSPIECPRHGSPGFTNTGLESASVRATKISEPDRRAKATHHRRRCRPGVGRAATSLAAS